jgi:hypothetical protein
MLQRVTTVSKEGLPMDIQRRQLETYEKRHRVQEEGKVKLARIVCIW